MVIDIEKIANDWLKEKKKEIKQSSLSVYYQRINCYIIPFFNNVITNDDVQKFVLFLTEKGLSKRSVRDVLITLESIFKYAETSDVIRDFEINVEMPTVLENRTKKYDLKCLSIAETKILRKYLVENISDSYNLAILIGLSSGLRIGEVTGLQYSAFDFKNHVLHITQTSQRITILDDNGKSLGTKVIVGSAKSKSSVRKVPLQKEILRHVKIMSELYSPTDFLFKSQLTNNPFENRTLRNKFYEVLDKLKLPRVPFHGLRHGFATNCIASGVDVKTTSEMLGHSNGKITLDIYTHPSFEQKKTAINKLGKLFS